LESHREYLTLLAKVQLGRRLRGKVEPADIVQEAFLEAHRDLQGFRGTTAGEFGAWLRQILARNLANVLRRYYGTLARDPRLERELNAELDRSSDALAQMPAASMTSPSQQAAHREDAVRLANLLHQLPRDYRDVLVCRYLEGMTFPQIADRMDRSVDAVEKLWVRALARLRRTMRSDT